MRVRIYRPAKSAMQSRCGCDAKWVVEPVLTSQRMDEPLMGWTSADDAMSTMSKRLVFATKGEAVSFVDKRGWAYDIEIPNERRVVPKSYLDNFNPDRRRSGR